MAIGKVVFGSNYAKTKNGNYYKKKNTGKKIGSMLGLGGGIVLSALPQTQLIALDMSSGIFKTKPTKMFLGFYGILGAGIIVTSLIGRALGSIPDKIINKKRINKADHIA